MIQISEVLLQECHINLFMSTNWTLFLSLCQLITSQILILLGWRISDRDWLSRHFDWYWIWIICDSGKSIKYITRLNPQDYHFFCDSGKSIKYIMNCFSWKLSIHLPIANERIANSCSCGAVTDKHDLNCVPYFVIAPWGENVEIFIWDMLMLNI